ILVNIRGTKAQLRALASARLRHHHDGLRRISKIQFELPAVLEEADADLVTASGAQLVVLGDAQELLSARLAGAAISVPSFTSPQSLLDSVAQNSSYLPTAFIDSWIAGLAGLFPQWCTATQLPNKTWEGRTVTAVRVRAGNSTTRPVVLFTSGLHAIALGGPGICGYFLYHPLNAYTTQTALKVGETLFPVEPI